MIKHGICYELDVFYPGFQISHELSIGNEIFSIITNF